MGKARSKGTNKVAESKNSGVRNITAQEMRDLAFGAGITVPIEQTWTWYDFEDSFSDRELVGFYSVLEEGEPVAVLALMKTDYHGFDFLWSKNGPVWLVEPTEKRERWLVDLLVRWIKDRSSRIAFVRLHLLYPGKNAHDPVQIISHDRTVVVQLDPDPEKILAGFSKKGRASVRRSIRRDPVEIVDETTQATADFAPYFELMEETGDRQGFTHWDKDVYEGMLRGLTEDHARVFAARREGRLVGWSVVTIAGPSASYYYAASNKEGRECRAPEQLVSGAASRLGAQGIKTLDLVGIGSDRAPSLRGLTPFKTKFAAEVTEVAPAYDIPVNKALYRVLMSLRHGKKRIEGLTSRLQRAKED